MPKSRFSPIIYGMWTAKNGDEILFSRSYHALWRRRPGQPAQPASLNEWVNYARQDYFHDGRCDKKMLVQLRKIERDFIAGRPIRFPVTEPPTKQTARPTLRLVVSN
jgi:hypothetical protein